MSNKRDRWRQHKSQRELYERGLTNPKLSDSEYRLLRDARNQELADEDRAFRDYMTRGEDE